MGSPNPFLKVGIVSLQIGLQIGPYLELFCGFALVVFYFVCLVPQSESNQFVCHHVFQNNKNSSSNAGISLIFTKSEVPKLTNFAPFWLMQCLLFHPRGTVWTTEGGRGGAY